MTGIGGLIFDAPPAGVSRWTRVRRFVRRKVLDPAIRSRWYWTLVRLLRLALYGPGVEGTTLPPRLLRHCRPNTTRFVVLCFRRTGSNSLPHQILMHNEIFNENGVHTYYKDDVLRNNWDYEGRDVNPD